jgi:nitrite reductase/ring-hydroxylating ferredoxin subunit
MSSDSFVRVGNVEELPEGTSRAFAVGRYEVALFNVDGNLYALENCCPHQGGPIVDGWIEGGTVTCPWHAWRFDLRTGKMTLGDFALVPRFEVCVRSGAVYVGTEPIAE